MSIAVMNLIWPANLRGARKIVLLRLADHAHDDGGSTYPSIAGLVAACGFGARTIQDALRDLEKLGVIVLVGKGTGGRGLAREYRIDLERVRELHPIHTEKGAAPAPFPPEKGAAPAEKGAAPAEKGAAPAPQPLRTIIEPSISPKCVREAFEKWWKAYPRRVAKGGAKKAYMQAVKSRKATPVELLAGAERYATARADEDPKFTKHPATWLNGECWLDESATGVATKPNPQAKDLSYA